MDRTSRSTSVRKPNYARVQSRVDTGKSVLKQHHGPASVAGINRLAVRQLHDILTTGEPEVLMLDLRDEEEFAQGHLAGAVNYPARLLYRATNYFSAEVLAFANKQPGRIIVLVDDNERTALAAANFFYEKGVDNAYVLTGGLQKVAERCPALMEGPSASYMDPSQEQHHGPSSTQRLAQPPPGSYDGSLRAYHRPPSSGSLGSGMANSRSLGAHGAASGTGHGRGINVAVPLRPAPGTGPVFR